VGLAFWPDKGFARSSAELIAADDNPQLAFQNMKNLILIAMNMKRRRLAVRGFVLQDGNPVRAIPA
jgi:hypothetical protein